MGCTVFLNLVCSNLNSIFNIFNVVRDRSLFMPQVGAEGEVGWGNYFLGSLRVGYVIFYGFQRFNGIPLIALYWLASYYIIVHKAG